MAAFMGQVSIKRTDANVSGKRVYHRKDMYFLM
jgi:hypothetical protein